MQKKESIQNWIVATMKPDTWYPVQKHNIETLKQLFNFHPNIELTFNKDYTKIKKTTWKSGKPN